MTTYLKYYVNGCNDRETAHLLMRLLLSYSDAFSLIYFRYHINEVLSKTAATIKDMLTPFEVDTRNVTEWPGTSIKNSRGHVYQMITYRRAVEAIPALEIVDNLWEWNYPQFPMDPCFYKAGYAWFATSTHEGWNALFLKDDEDYPLVSDLESLGFSFISEGRVEQSDLFFNEYSFY